MRRSGAIHRRCALLAGGATILVALGCPSAPLPEDPYVAEVTRAAREERADRYAEAANAYERAATLTSDEAVARTAEYRAAQAAERAGEPDRALAMYLALADEHPGTAEAGRGLYDAAMLTYRLGREEEAIGLFRRTMRQAPDAPLTEFAVRRMVQLYRDGERLSELERVLGEEIAAGSDPDVVALLYLSLAQLHADLDRPREAYVDLENGLEGCTYPYCAFWDDLPWLGARIARTAADYAKAIEFLDRLLATKEECWIMGGYYSAYYDDAQKMKAEILRDDLGEPEEAAEAFLELEDFTESVLRDDGVYEAALLYLDRLDEAERGCSALRDLLDDYPDSNRRTAAEERLARPPCAGSP
jgi:tetratricopeptide (TPR) repeat protein